MHAVVVYPHPGCRPFSRLRCTALLLLLGLTLCWASSALAAGQAVTATQAAIHSLSRDGGLPADEVLRQLTRLAAGLESEPAAIRDLARLTEVRALLDVGRVAEAERLARAMQAQPERAGRPLAWVHAQLAVLRVLLRQSNIKEAFTLAREILARREYFEREEVASEVLAAVGSALGRAGEHETAVALFIEGLNAAARSDRTDQKPYLLIGLCGINYDLQNYGKALEYCRQAADIAEQTGNKMARAAAAINLSLAYDASGDEKNQLAELQTSLTLSRELGLKRAEGMARINLAEYAMTRGDFQAGREHVSEGLRIGRELSDPIMIAVSLTNLGFASAELGNVAGGLRLYEDGIATAEQAGEMSYVVAFLPGLADLHEMAGDPTEAVKALRRRVAEGDKLYQKVHAEALAELQGKYDADNRQREIRMLKLDNQLKTAELERRNLQVRVYWLLAAVLVLVTALLLVAYRRVRTANRKLAVENIDLEQHSLCDPLTGLFNRRALQAFLDPGEPGHPRRQPLSPMAFVMIDADRFKAINDRHGHTYGDAVLIELASRLSRLVRPDDRLFRLGGEEFMLLLPAISGPDLARLCQRILLAVNHAPVAVEEARIPLTVSLGACHFPLAQDGALGLDWQRHLHLADLALYHAKRAGRNRACLIDRIADGSAALLKQIEADFGAAMANGSIAATMVVGEADAEPLAAPGERATPA